MSDRGILFLFSILVTIAALGAAGWLIATGQAAYVDGLFLTLTCLVVAFSFGLYIAFLIRRAAEQLQAPAPKAAVKAAGTARAKVEPAAEQVV